MATRLQIRTKYGIEISEHPDAANEELTPEEASEYERIIRLFAQMEAKRKPVVEKHD